MTIFGKILVHLTVALSLVGFGIGLWLIADYRDWDKTVKDINNDIERRRYGKRLEEVALADLMTEIKRGDRLIPWDLQAQLTQPTPQPPKQSVAQAKVELGEIEKVNQARLDEANRLQLEYGSLVVALRQARDETLQALTEQKDLREQIKPEDSEKKPLRDQIGENLTAKEAAETGQERIRPDLVNERAKLFLLQERNADLKRRLTEVGGQ